MKLYTCNYNDWEATKLNTNKIIKFRCLQLGLFKYIISLPPIRFIQVYNFVASN